MGNTVCSKLACIIFIVTEPCQLLSNNSNKKCMVRESATQLLLYSQLHFRSEAKKN
jgi:hypothetical protein